MGISKDQIKYLSFEGGGGKGNAFVGAIAALQKLKVLQFQNNRMVGQIKEISGASAGAITALLLGSGYSFYELRAVLLSTQFDKFFDNPQVGENIVVGKGFSFVDAATARKRLKGSPSSVEAVMTFVSFVLTAYGLNKELSAEARKAVVGFLLDKYGLTKENPKLAEKLRQNVDLYLQCLILDFGLFSGDKIQRAFNLWISTKIYMAKRNIRQDDREGKLSAIEDAEKDNGARGGKVHLWTFREHFEVFRVKLKFTSVNFRTAKLQILSVDTTPDFPVAQAARMSMSLPCIFKPVVINGESLKECKLEAFWEGLWVDGGLFDNAPVKVFNDNASTLLFRLGDRKENNKLNSIFEFLTAYLTIGLASIGSGEATETTFPQDNIVPLDVAGTSLLRFDLDVNDFDALARVNYFIAMRFFGSDAPWPDQL